MKPMIKLIQKTLLTSAVISLVSTFAQADEVVPRRYSVELIVFSYEKTDTDQSEKWPEETQVELPDQYQVLYPESAVNSMSASIRKSKQIRLLGQVDEKDPLTDVGVEGRPLADENNLSVEQISDLQQGLWPDRFSYHPSQLKLTPQKQKLDRRSNEFRVLYHQAWHMPLTEKEQSVPIRIQGGEQFDGFYELEGSIRISVARYLHVETQLYLSEFEPVQTERQTTVPAYTEPNQSLYFSNSNIVPSAQLSLLGVRQFKTKQVIALKQTRRMRSGELHYIDNPRYGILIQMTPYKTATNLVSVN